jgi:hypothetical protein
MSKGGGSTNTTTTQKADPWKEQQPYLKDIFSQAQQQYYSPGPYYYPGEQTAKFSSQELEAQQWMVDLAKNPQALGMLNQGAGAQEFLLGDVLRADSNPYMAGYAEGAIRPAWESLLRQGLPGVDSGAVASGQYGGSRQGIAQGLAISDAMRQSLDTTSKMYSDMYGQNLEAMQRGLALMPQTYQSLQMPGQLLSAVGETRRGMEQQLIDDAMAKWNYEQNLAAAKLAQYVSAVQGNYGGQSNSTTSGGSGSSSTGGNIAGAALTGLGAYGMLTAPAIGMSAGAAGLTSGALALLSLFG